MKQLLKSKGLKLVAAVVVLLAVGALLAGAVGHSETAQSAVVGTVTAPLHFAAQKISNALDGVFGELKGSAEYEKRISALEEQIGDYKAQLADYESLRKQNELYKDFLELKEENPDYQFAEVSVIGRDSADIYKSFTVSKGSLSGIKEGNAVLYKKNLVGIVDKVYPDYSVVKTILDPDVSISAYEMISGEISYVTGNARLARENKCKMANLSSATNVAYGSIICTAGIGGTVPKGLIIGSVSAIEDEPTDISSYAAIVPEANIDDITSCFVLTDF